MTTDTKPMPQPLQPVGGNKIDWNLVHIASTEVLKLEKEINKIFAKTSAIQLLNPGKGVSNTLETKVDEIVVDKQTGRVLVRLKSAK